MLDEVIDPEYFKFINGTLPTIYFAHDMESDQNPSPANKEVNKNCQPSSSLPRILPPNYLLIIMMKGGGLVFLFEDKDI